MNKKTLQYLIKEIKKYLNTVTKGLLEIIFPKSYRCIICNKEDVEGGLCYECKKKIVPSLDDDLCIGYYKGILKELILKLKYKQDFNAGIILADLIEEKLNNLDGEYYLTFIPVSKKTLKERGFNQCEYLANELSFRVGYPVINALEKVRETQVQKTLTKEERKTNLIGAFKLKDSVDIKGKRIILIDDVITTGATLGEGKKILKENGALEIKILTLAKSHI